MANNPVILVQQTFFDRPKVIHAIGKKNAAVLARTGGFARKVMQRGMRRSPTVSAPGAYPHAHGGRGLAHLRELIFFGFEKKSVSVHVGPVLLTPDRTIKSGTNRVPKLVNEGGAISRLVRTKRGKYRRVRQNYLPRPFVDLTAPHAAKALADNMAKIALRP